MEEKTKDKEDEDESFVSVSLGHSPSTNKCSSTRVLTAWEGLSFGVGHFFNDSCLTMWFTYFLVYLRYVLEVPNITSGVILMIGMATDAFFTPFVGFCTDRSTLGLPFCLRGHGNRKTIHLIGSIIVLLFFPLLFSNCWGCPPLSTLTPDVSINITNQIIHDVNEEDDNNNNNNNNNNMMPTIIPIISPPSNEFLLYLTLIAMMYQIGWVTVQISHLSMIPELTPGSLERMDLSIIRTFFDVMTHVTVYTVAYIIFTSGTSLSDPKILLSIDYTDGYKFQNIALIITCIGVIFTIIFHIGTPNVLTTTTSTSQNSNTTTLINNIEIVEPNNEILPIPIPTETSHLVLFSNKPSKTTQRKDIQKYDDDDDDDDKNNKREGDKIKRRRRLKTNEMKWKDWFQKKEYYQVALLLTLARVFGNSLSSILPLYLQEELHAPKSLLAIIPLVLNLSGIVFSLLIKFTSTFLSKKLISMIGGILGFFGCIWLSFDSEDGIASGRIYVVCCLMGGGAVMMVIVALALIADLIGENTESGAFVYGSIACLEKLTNGLFILTVQVVRGYCTLDCRGYYRNAISHGISLTALASTIIVLTLKGNTGQTQNGSSSKTTTATTTTKTIKTPNFPMTTTTIKKNKSSLYDGGAATTTGRKDYGSLKRGFSIFGSSQEKPIFD